MAMENQPLLGRTYSISPLHPIVGSGNGIEDNLVRLDIVAH